MLIEFLSTKTSKDDLAAALRVLQEFKNLECDQEWMAPFSDWLRLEQLEEYLEFIVNGKPLSKETKDEINRNRPPDAQDRWMDWLKRYIGREEVS
jgi:hypothetical protein